MSARQRLPLLLLALLSLVAAVWAGLLRLGWAWPLSGAVPAAAHGPLFVSGFLGTLICLERAVALEKRWAYLPALVGGLGSLLMLTGRAWTWSGRLLLLAALGLALLFAVILRRHRAVYTWVMALGAAAWVVGNALIVAGRPVYLAVPWWMAFLILTIAGERLELGRVLRHGRRAVVLFLAAATVFVAGVALTLFDYAAGMRLAGLGMVLLAAWLLVYDIARRNLRRPGLTGYIAVCLFGGTIWLGVGGVLAMVYGGAPAGPHYDAVLHAVFLGFVFSMIFGHAPLIFPGVLGRPMAYTPAFYVALVGLHLSLILRVAGDLLGLVALRRWGGLLNGVALLLFFATMALALVRGSRAQEQPASEN